MVCCGFAVFFFLGCVVLILILVIIRRSSDSLVECKTNYPGLIERSECDNGSVVPGTTSGSDETPAPDTTSGSDETPMTQQGCLDTYDTLMPTSSCDDIQIARTLGIEDCSPSGAGKIQIESSARVRSGNSNWAGQGDPVCSSLNNEREAGSEGRCATFYEIHGHSSGFGKTCRNSRAGDSGTNCMPGDWCIR